MAITKRKLSAETTEITDLTNDVRIYGIEDSTTTPSSGYIDLDNITLKIANKSINSNVSGPTASEDGYILKWDNGNTQYTLFAIALTDLSDTPSSITASQFLRGNSGGTAFEFVNLLSNDNTFTPAVVFDAKEKYFTAYSQSGALSITLDSNTYAKPCYIYVTIITDGSAISFPAGWKEIQNDYANDSDNYGLIVFYDGVYYQYSLYLIG